MTEAYSNLPDQALLSALTDPLMVEPTSIGVNPLFDPAYLTVGLGREGTMNQGNLQFSLPLKQTHIVIGQPYGTEIRYQENQPYVDCEIWIPFRVFTTTAPDQRDVRRRLDFARDSRAYLFSKFGLSEVAQVVRERPLAYNGPIDLIATEYVWRFWWARDSSGITPG